MVIYVNINSSPEESYPYKMPILEVSHTGDRTLILNLFDVGRCLARKPEYILKFWSGKYRREISLNRKSRCCSIEGRHDQSDLQFSLLNFITEYVLCDSCESPRTKLVVGKDELQKECDDCGGIDIVTGGIYSTQKLVKYIMTQLPPTCRRTWNLKC